MPTQVLPFWTQAAQRFAAAPVRADSRARRLRQAYAEYVLSRRRSVLLMIEAARDNDGAKLRLAWEEVARSIELVEPVRAALEAQR